ncbi:MAG: DUF5522 domain-containing protein [Bacteroidetes bacterium]|nr:DUF5522 domain-containing protein [Bacteroidota bacterium]
MKKKNLPNSRDLQPPPKPDKPVLPLTPIEGDYYFTEDGLMVFTAQYHLRRGFCCGSGCRHCPYKTRE